LLFGVLINVENNGAINFHLVDVRLAEGVEWILCGAKIIKINVTSELGQRFDRVAHRRCRILDHDIFKHLN